MLSMISEIKDFYFYYTTSAELKPENPTEWIIKTSLCTRSDFMHASLDGAAFLVRNIGIVALSGIAVVATAGLNPRLKASLRSNAYEAVVHAGSIPISIAGLISPDAVNRDFLKTIEHEEKKRVEGNATFPKIAVLAGGIVMRKRRPINRN